MSPTGEAIGFVSNEEGDKMKGLSKILWDNFPHGNYRHAEEEIRKDIKEIIRRHKRIKRGEEGGEYWKKEIDYILEWTYK